MASIRSQGFQEWIMFVVGIGLIIFFAASRTELSVYWMLLIGSLLGFSMLVAGVQNQMDDSKMPVIGPRKKAPKPAPMIDERDSEPEHDQAAEYAKFEEWLRMKEGRDDKDE